jgi:hypothetical protein
MLSAVYQLSTDLDETNFAKDSGNRYYWRANERRMDSEQLRDSVLAVAGNLDDSLGGPSADLKPDFMRRTVYGKVSRYKLDEYLQLFDFPSPAISAEKRFSTTVPLQRLFLMNSDFMQIEAEEVAKRVVGEADNASRIKKMYRIVLNREPSEDELKIAIAYLHSEPMKEYEETKDKEAKAAEVKNQEATPKPGEVSAGDTKPAQTAQGQTSDQSAGEGADGTPPEMGMGMMMGVRRGGRGGAAPPEYSATPLGRFAKVLLSSSEFVFID